MTATRRSFRIACPTWRHVKVFCDPALRRGQPITLRLPFAMKPGDRLAVQLRLPNHLSVDIDSLVESAKPLEAGRHATRLILDGLDDFLIARLQQLMVEDGVVVVELAESFEGSGWGPAAEAGISDANRDLVDRLVALRSRTSLAALGLEPNAGADAVMRAFRHELGEVHPDVVARRGAGPLAILARELSIELDAVRDASRTGGERLGSGRAGAFLSPANVDDWHARGRRNELRPLSQTLGMAVSELGASEAETVAELETDLVEEAIADLDAGRVGDARTKLADAVRADPRNRPVRALYHVAYGRELMSRGQAVPATTQFEAALRQDPECERARRALDLLRAGDGGQGRETGLWKRLFGG